MFDQGFAGLWMAFWSDQLVWQQPLWLWALLLPFVFLILSKLRQYQQKQGYADAHLWPWVKVENPKNIMQANAVWQKPFFWLASQFSALRLLSIAWVAFVIALAGPSSLVVDYQTDHRQGVDVMIDIDVSQSMLAEDMGVNRLTFAKNLSESLINELTLQDRVGLNMFAGQSHAVLPLTHDKQVFLQALKTVSVGILPLQGSWLERALLESLNRLQQTAQKAKVLVVFTDGAPPFWKSPSLPPAVMNLASASSQDISATGVKVIYVGVGLKRASTIPDATNKTGNLYVNGLLVQSRLEEQQLLRLAQKTGGRYLQANGSQEFLQTLKDEILQHATVQTSKTEMQQWHYYSLPFVWLGLFLLLMAFYGRTVFGFVFRLFFGLKPRLKGSHEINSSMLMGGLLSAFLSIPLTGFWSSPSQAADSQVQQQQANLQQAFTAFENAEYESAQTFYDAVDEYAGLFGAGSAAYRLQDFEAAVLYFRAAAWQAKLPQQRAQALYNLGNSFYLANLLPQAIEAYQQALRYEKPYAKAEHNLALAEQRFKLEQKANQGKEQSGEGEGNGDGKGSQGKDADGAFYGGQKPNPDADDGKGADGDSEAGSRHGNQVNLPLAEQQTDYRLNRSIAELRVNSLAQQKPTNSVLAAQRQQQRAEKFTHELQQLDDDHPLLLKRLFEREAGFEAAQEKAHPIPGVQPW